ncbi:alpha/beta hydrolase [Amycolatopsis suaedae]|nr:alpha/beta hydrolase [Amycolatopsis suaedae]
MNDAYNKIIACGDDLRAAGTPYGWSGQAASAAAGKINAIIDGLEEHAADVAAARRSFGDTGDAITGVVNGVREAEDLAKAHHFSIGDDGAVIDHGPPPDTPEDQKAAVAEERKAIAEEVRERVIQVLRSATDVDDDFCAVLDKILSEHTIDAAATSNDQTSLAAAGNAGHILGSLSVPAPPPDGATATQNAAWWASLSRNQRLQLVADRPDLVGNRDGLPATYRSQANLNAIPKERNRLRTELDNLKAQASGATPAEALMLNLQGQEIENKLASLDKIDEMMYVAPGQVNPDRQLLSLDMSGDSAMAAVANGNVDTARHVAVFTPGMNSAVNENMLGYVKEMESVQRHSEYMSERFGDEGSVATVTWLGYEPPRVPDLEANFLEVGKTGGDLIGGYEADKGAEKLASFNQGINASRSDDPHLTALGHSYGSLTTGIALQHNTGVDDAVFFGSPGISDAPDIPISPDGVNNEIKDLKIPQGHAYNLEADGDAVADIGKTGRFGSDPGTMSGMQQLSTEGAVTKDGKQVFGVTGHSDYLKSIGDGPDKMHSTSLHNMASIVAGLPTMAVRTP